MSGEKSFTIIEQFRLRRRFFYFH